MSQLPNVSSVLALRERQEPLPAAERFLAPQGRLPVLAQRLVPLPWMVFAS